MPDLATQTTIALEGLPCVGKSSSIDRVIDLALPFTRIDEYHDLLGRVSRKRSEAIPQSEADQLGRIRTYQQLDEQRWSQIRRTHQDLTPLLDRCHLSVLAYSKALSRCYGIGTWPLAKELYERRLESPDFMVSNPDLVLFVRADVSVTTRRMQLYRPDVDRRLRSQTFLRILQESYEELETPNSTVKVIEAGETIEETIASIVQLLYPSALELSQ